MSTQPEPFDEGRLQSFLGSVVGDFGAALSSMLVYIGLKEGLYEAMAGAGWLTSEELASRTGCAERYIREWLLNQATSGYLDYDPESSKYRLPPEHAVVLTDQSSPFYAGGGFWVVKAMLRAEPRIREAFRTGGGMKWGEHDPDLFVGTERFFRPGYATHLMAEWIPAMDGAEARLKEGALVADIGCGHGASTVLMAKAFPNSKFVGYDSHEASIETARERARAEGVSDRVRFEVADASSFPDGPYDMIAFFDCFHDMGDPAGAAKRAKETLEPGGWVLMVEPMAGNRVEENINPIGRTFSAASTLCCTANSLAFGGPGLGAVATEAAIKSFFDAAGFRSFRRATETPFNRIFEARP